MISSGLSELMMRPMITFLFFLVKSSSQVLLDNLPLSIKNKRVDGVSEHLRDTSAINLQNRGSVLEGKFGFSTSFFFPHHYH